MRLQIIKNIEPNLVSAYEEAIMLARINNITDDVISVWKHPRAIYLTNNASILYFNKDYADAYNFPTTRSAMFNGKNTSILTLGGTYSVAIALGKNEGDTLEDFGNKYYYDLFSFVSKKFGVELEKSGNDMVVKNTNKKLFGCIYSEAKNVFIGNNVFSLSIPEHINLNDLYTITNIKYADKELKDAQNRITSIFTETGKLVTDDEIINAIEEYLTSVNILFNVEEGLSTEEKKILKEVTPKHISDNWIKYGKFAYEYY